MDAIRILSKCAASGQHLPQGAVLKVPAQVSADDAGRLVRMGRAEVYVKPAKASKSAEVAGVDAAPAPDAPVEAAAVVEPASAG